MLEFGKFLLVAFFIVSAVIAVFRLFKLGQRSDEYDRAYKVEMIELLQNIDASLTCIACELHNAAEVSEDA